MTFFVLISFDY